MNKRILIAGLLVFFLVTCDRQGARMTTAAENCEKAIVVGALEVAEELCTIALGENLGADLKPKLRSDRLYRLGHIQRMQAKYPEAERLIMQSLAIEETLSDHDNLARGHRLLEMSLIKAGLGNWEEGALFLERALPYAMQFSEKEQASMINVLRHYAGKLEQLEQPELAAQFRATVTELESRQAAGTTGSP